MTSYKLIPYGISNFEQVRRENLYYADKTEYISKMENAGNFLFLIRPRRFGKSLFLSMLRYYYDVQEKDNFGNLFSGLWTPFRSCGLRRIRHRWQEVFRCCIWTFQGSEET